MKIQHFEIFKPVCPVCLAKDRTVRSLLSISCVESEHRESIAEGILRCSNSLCQSEFPIIDGLPIIVPNLRRFIQANLSGLISRTDLSSSIESLLSDCCGPDMFYESAKQHISSYAWSHYSDLAPSLTSAPQGNFGSETGGIVKLLSECWMQSGRKPEGVTLDVGCGVGRSTFEIAEETQTTVLGIDLHVPMMRMASHVLRHGQVRYSLRRHGVVYDRIDFPVSFPNANHVDFWICDATILPLQDRSVSSINALNILDCISSPAEFLWELNRLARTGGRVLISSPYDWSAAATPIEHWIGGHSQRGPLRGDPRRTLVQWLEAFQASNNGFSLSVIAEKDLLPWCVRLHDRSCVKYELHMVILEKS